MNNNLQKLLGLFIILVVGIGIGSWLSFQGSINEGGEQINPPILIEEPGDKYKPTPVACTADAKVCPDGSAVGRVGPDCEFAACPSAPDPIEKTTICTDEMKQTQICTMEYAPVCGLVEVQCITTPCDPVPETFGNGCSACAQGNVISYTEGECSL